MQEQYQQLMAEREGLQAQQELKLKECRRTTEAIEELTKQAHSELETAVAAFKELEDDVRKSDCRSSHCEDPLIDLCITTVAYSAK